MDLRVMLNVCVSNLQLSKRALIIRYNRAAISLKISEGDGTEFNYYETVAVQGLF